MATIRRPFSLKDQCKFKILACVHQYPLDSFSKLPAATRRVLFMALSKCDRLHFKGTSFLHGLEDMTNDPAIIPTNEFMLNLLFQYTKTTAFIKLGAMNFHNVVDHFDCFKPFSEAAPPYESLIHFVELIQKLPASSSHYTHREQPRPHHVITSQPEKPPQNTLQPKPQSEEVDSTLSTFKPISFTHGYFALPDLDATPPFSSDFIKKYHSIEAIHTVLFPMRHFHYFEVEAFWSILGITIEIENNDDYMRIKNFKIGSFIDYCRVTPPTCLSIDTSKFMFSAIWNSYEHFKKSTIDDAYQNQRFINKLTKVKLTAVAPFFPYLERILSSVEFLKIGRNDCSSFVTMYHKEECYVEIPYLLLCNIASKEGPPLKCIHAYTCTSEGGLQLFYTIAGFICGEEYINMAHYDRRLSKTNLFYTLSMKHLYSIPLESLAITRVPAKDGSVGDYQSTIPQPESKLAVSVLQQICKATRNSLKHLDVSGIDFAFKPQSYSWRGEPKSWKFNNEYLSFVSSFFVKFVSQPHFQSLTLGELPENQCYELVSAFLITPTSHDQELRISIAQNKLQQASEPPMAHSLPDPSQFPSTNDLHKSLIFESTSDDCVLTKQVVGLRTLNFKKLQIPINSIGSIHPNPNIDISHVSLDFSLHLKHNETILEQSLNMFLLKNPSLTVLEFIYNPDTIHSSFWSLASSALESVCRPPRSTAVLHEVRLCTVTYSMVADGATSHRSFLAGRRNHDDIVRFFSVIQKAKVPLSIYGGKHLFHKQPIVKTLIKQFRKDKLESIRFSDSPSGMGVTQDMMNNLKQITDNLIIQRK